MKQFFSKTTMAIAVALSLLLPAISAVAWDKVAKPAKPVSNEQIRARSARLNAGRSELMESKPGMGVSGDIMVHFAGPSKVKAPANHLTRAITPRGHFLAVVPQYAGMTSENQAFLARIDATSGAVSPLFYGSQFRSDEYSSQSSAYKDGILYQPYMMSSIFETTVQWRMIDTSNGQVLRTVDFGQELYAHPYTLTYDEVTKKFWGLTYDDTGSYANVVVVIDPEKREVEERGILSSSYGFLSSIVYNPLDQNLYLFNEYNQVYLLSRDTNVLSDAGTLTTPYDESLFPNDESACVTYSPLDHAFVASVPVTDEQAFYLYYIDPETFEVEAGAKLQSALSIYIGSLLCTDPYAEWGAPSLPDRPVVKFDSNSLSGKISYKVPSTLFSGVEIGAQKVHTVVALDGKALVDKSLDPGTEETIDVTTTAGLHKATVTCDLGDKLVSPTATTEFYTGNDNPKSPRNLKYDGMRTLSWSAPASGGAHGGYVNESELYYDVYFGDTKQNSRPITATEYTFIQPVNMQLTSISVVAVAGGMTSEPTTLNEIIGRALTLPVDLRPEDDKADIFKIVDGNGDTNEFHYTAISAADFKGFVMSIGYYNDPDDWVMLPRINFPDASKLYNLNVGIGGIMTGVHYEDVEIFIGKAANPSAMTTKIWNRSHLQCPMPPNHYDINFAVPEAGEYVIGIHYISKRDRRGRGLSLADFKVSATEQSSAVPAGVSNVTIKGNSTGECMADITMTLPTLDAVGNQLPADKPLTVFVECQGLTEAVSATGLPGTQVTVNNIEAKEDGINRFIITPMNDNGYGVSYSFEGYVGLDTPLAVTNVRGTTSDDNATLHLEWDKPAGIGQNGSYVNPDDVTYDIYTLSGVLRTKYANTAKTSFDFTPLVTKQTHYWVGPAAGNRIGFTTDVPFHGDFIGKLYELPMYEEYGTTKFDYEPVYRRTGAGYENVTWSNERSVAGLDVDGNPVVNNGCVIMYQDGMTPTQGEIILPKATTIGLPNILFTAKIWDYSSTPKITLWGCTSDNQEKRLIQELSFERTKSGHWTAEDIHLPEEYFNKPWIQLFIHVNFSINPAEYLIIDNYSIKTNVDHDLKISAITAPLQISTGTNIEVFSSICNAGLEDNSGSVKIGLYTEDGKMVANQVKKLPRMRAGQILETYTKFDILSEWAENNQKLIARATVMADDDEVATNDSREVTMDLVKSNLPVVNDLTGSYNDDRSAINLDWTEPDTRHGGYEDIETTPAFTTSGNVGAFRNVDLDKRKSFPISGLTWPGCDEPGAWTVIDAKELSLMNDPRLYPHSGKQYLMARAIEYDPYLEEAPQACDVLVSPEVVPGSKISFWYNTLSVEYKEYVELWVSSTDDTLGDEIIKGTDTTPDKCGSFRKVYSFSKSGSEDWELVEWKLPEDAKYFALVYRSFDSFGAMLDDIVYTPAALDTWVIDHYEVVRRIDGSNDWETLANVKTPHAVIENPGDHNASYYVVTYVETPKGLMGGPRSNKQRLFAASIDDITALNGIYGETGAIVAKGHAGKTLDIYAGDGKYLRTVLLTSSEQRIGIDGGVYIVKAGNAVAKVVVK